MYTPLPVVLELVGPAGSGKSTLMSVLSQRNPEITGVRVELRKHWPLVCAAALAATSQNSPGCNGNRGLGQAAALRLYGGALRNVLGTAPRVVFLDEGPVFRLVRLRLAAVQERRSAPSTNEAVTTALRRWAGTVDGLVWLDAPDPVLAERIRGRAKAHRVKGSSGGEITDFLAHYRAAYARVTEELFPEPEARVLHIESDAGNPEDLARRAMAYIDQEWPAWQIPSAP